MLIEALTTVDALCADGLIADYAIAGGAAFIVWNEPIATDDLDVLVILKGTTDHDNPLRHVVEALALRGVRYDGDHAWIGGVPVHFLPASDPRMADAVRDAAVVSYDGHPMRVLRPADLVASWNLDNATQPYRWRDLAARLMDAGTIPNVYPPTPLPPTEPAWIARIWEGKRTWHAQQRALPLHEKMATVLKLQHRQREINRIKAQNGLPEYPIRVWGMQARTSYALVCASSTLSQAQLVPHERGAELSALNTTWLSAVSAGINCSSAASRSSDIIVSFSSENERMRGRRKSLRRTTLYLTRSLLEVAVLTISAVSNP